MVLFILCFHSLAPGPSLGIWWKSYEILLSLVSLRMGNVLGNQRAACFLLRRGGRGCSLPIANLHCSLGSWALSTHRICGKGTVETYLSLLGIKSQKKGKGGSTRGQEQHLPLLMQVLGLGRFYKPDKELAVWDTPENLFHDLILKNYICIHLLMVVKLLSQLFAYWVCMCLGLALVMHQKPKGSHVWCSTVLHESGVRLWDSWEQVGRCCLLRTGGQATPQSSPSRTSSFEKTIWSTLVEKMFHVLILSTVWPTLWDRQEGYKHHAYFLSK